MGEWTSTTLGRFISLRRGHDLPEWARKPGAVPVIGSGGPVGWHDASVAKGPGITIGRAANLGVPTLVEHDFWPLNTTLYVTDFHGNDVNFTYYLLRTLDLTGFNSGSVQPMLNRNYIHAFPLKVPSSREQQRIAGALSALDDKIATNSSIARTAHDLASAWYTGAIARARQPSTLGELIDLRYGKALPESLRKPGDVPVYGSGGVIGEHDSAAVGGPGVIVGRKGTVGSVYWSQHPFFPIDTTYYVELRRPGIPMEFVYFTLRSLGLGEMNSDSAVPGLNRKNALSLPVKVPTKSDLGQFTEKARLLFALRYAATTETHALVGLRDTLLPRLVSGELRVRDAENAVEEAL